MNQDSYLCSSKNYIHRDSIKRCQKTIYIKKNTLFKDNKVADETMGWRSGEVENECNERASLSDSHLS
jgi:hypothetical protein